MNITITTDEKDSVLLESFAVATGWSEDTGKTLEEWMRRKVGEYVTREARTGFVRTESREARTVFVRAVQESTLLAKAAIQAPVVSAELAGMKLP